MLINFSNSRDFPDGKIHHEFKDLNLVIWENRLSVGLIKLRANLRKHLITSNPTTCSHPHLMENALSDLRDNINTPHVIV